MVAMTLWLRDDVGDNQEGKKEAKVFNDDNVFATPKPEKLMERVIMLASNEGDLVLDSFLGSGTTAAVAHKMGRRWIGIELGEHAKTHCYPRLKAVVEGEQGGISKAVKWQGGGGFKFYTLAIDDFLLQEYGSLQFQLENCNDYFKRKEIVNKMNIINRKFGFKEKETQEIFS
jgi:adenine-specific DNA-methyltransferase